MAIKLSDIISKTDWAKIIILLAVSIGCWIWVFREYQKPIFPAEWEQGTISHRVR